MTELADFDFSLEFSEQFATRILQACFTEGATPRRFSYDQTGQPGLIGTRSVTGGPALYQSYLLEIEAGYDLILTKLREGSDIPAKPRVNFDARNQLVVIDFDVGIKIPRNLVGRIFDIAAVDTALAADPAAVDVAKDYTEEFRSGPRTDPYPGQATPHTMGAITIQFAPAMAVFGGGRRLFGQTAGVTMSNVRNVEILPGTIEATLRTFANIFASKTLTFLISTEANGYDVTPMIGNLTALDMTLLEPPKMRIGVAPSGPVIAYAANVVQLTNVGDISQLKYLLDSNDFCVSFSEAMFNDIISYLYIYDAKFPKEFNQYGMPVEGGPVKLGQPRLEFLNDELDLTFPLSDAAGNTDQVKTLVDFHTVSQGLLRVVISIVQSSGSVLNGPGVQNLASVLAFHILGAATGPVLTSLFDTSTHNSLDAGLSEFLRTGALAFGFRTPIRGTRLFVNAKPMAIRMRPGICTFFNSAVITS